MSAATKSGGVGLATVARVLASLAIAGSGIAPLGGCEDRPERTDPREGLPAWARDVPGDAALVVADPTRRDALAELVRGATDLLTDLVGPVVEAAPGVFAVRAEGIRTGWPVLATSASFQDAWAALDPVVDGRAVVYADLQLPVELVSKRVETELTRRLLDAIDPRDLRWAIGTVERVGDGGGPPAYVFSGRIATGGSAAGLGALLAAPGGMPALLPADPEAGLSIDVRCDPEVGRRMVEALGADRGPLSAGALAGQLAGAAQRLVAELARHVDGRAALRVPADGGELRLALGVRDPAAAAAALGKVAAPTSDGGYRLPAEQIARFVGDRLVVGPDDGSEPPPTADAALDASCVVTANLDAGRRLTLRIHRTAPDRLEVRGRLD